MAGFSDRTVGWGGFDEGFGEGFMANDDYLDMLSLLGTSGTLSNQIAPIENPPFFITVKPSEKGKRAGVEEREDGLYLGDVKIADREILVK